MKRQLAFISFMGLFAAFVFSSTLIVGGCGGDGDGAYLGAPAPSINTRGGDGGSDTGDGGWGGDVFLGKRGSPEPVEVLSSGTVDASFTPTPAAPNLGAAPAMITASKTIPLFPDVPSFVEPGAGEPYMFTGDTNLYISDGNGNPADDVAATGLDVAAGATLTLPLNMGTAAFIAFLNDVANNGTITTLDVDPTQRGSLQLLFFSFYGGSAVNTSGTVPGQSGGDILLSTQGSPNAAIYNRGAINTAGAGDPSGNGGDGGDVLLAGYEALENTGAVTTAGGTGGAGNGGAGGDVDIFSGVSYVYNSGAINSTGGNGTASGGWGGDVLMTSATVPDASGELRNSGNVTTAGGNGAGGPGGWGGYIELLALSEDLRNNAALNSAGGDTSDATSDGGWGGDIFVASAPNNVIAGPAGNLLHAGNLDSSGGNAVATGSGDGGWGGDVLVGIDASGWFTGITGLPAPTTQRLSLFSCSNIEASGGSGNLGGLGGWVEVNNDGERWDAGAVNWVDDIGGDVTNQAAITTRGGSVAAGSSATPAMGGIGGFVYLYGDINVFGVGDVINPAAERVTNSGRIDTCGGHSLALTADPGFNGGIIDLWTTNDITNTGAWTANGGSDAVNDDTLGTGFGAGGGQWLYLDAILGDATNSGAINANGGDGETLGGAGSDELWLGNFQVVNSANISLRGGDADTGVAGSVGGAGGDIWMNDVDVPDNTGTLDVSGGAGDTPGADGTIFP